MRRCHILLLTVLYVTLASCGHKGAATIDNTPRDTRADGFVYLENNRFMLDDSVWFPLMVNYKVDWDRNGSDARIIPATYYGMWSDSTLAQHFGMIREMGFNAVRVCIDVMDYDESQDTYRYPCVGHRCLDIRDDQEMILSAIDGMLSTAREKHLRVMLLLKAPLTAPLADFTAALLQHLCDNPTLFAYDFMNEPLYFDPAETRDKTETYRIVDGWRDMMDRHAPHQLFTIAFSEPIEVFEWDPSLLPVDFVEMHTYHPMRVANEMYWYGHYCGKPWMVGETSLPADGDSVDYEWQCRFMRQSYLAAIANGAAGYGWWEFGDCPPGVNFEAQYSGLTHNTAEQVRTLKPAAHVVRTLPPPPPIHQLSPAPPSNYCNMTGYRNIAIQGHVRDKKSGKGIDGAVVRGWNEDWSVGVNTFTDSNGCFVLYSNDRCVHFEISAPGYSHQKFDKGNYTLRDRSSNPVRVGDLDLPDRNREYQQIPLLEHMRDTLFFNYRSEDFVYELPTLPPYHGELGTFKLRRLD